MSQDLTVILAAFGVGTTVVLLLWMLLGYRRNRVDSRLATLSLSSRSGSIDASLSVSALPKIGAAFMPEDESKRNRLKDRMTQAGLYRSHALGVFLGVKVILMLSPIAVGVLLSSMSILPLQQAVIYSASAGLLGTLAPSIWLGQLKKKRQKNIRRALPDALDVIIVCLEGGLSLPAAFDRVASELRTAHQLLADEMAILKREIQLGCTTGEALRKFAHRFDIEELRGMASVVAQAERFGASVTKALRVHADTLRLKRHQRAEAMAQKAPVKLIFPTALCIFPALYIILMAPAFMQVFEALDYVGR